MERDFFAGSLRFISVPFLVNVPIPVSLDFADQQHESDGSEGHDDFEEEEHFVPFRFWVLGLFGFGPNPVIVSDMQSPQPKVYRIHKLVQVFFSFPILQL